uniref:Staygreen protein domain-containing protein n=1 Tax=Chenopodium quinoa TaxID=63459 RepID=A0A803LQU0_CHEQI
MATLTASMLLPSKLKPSFPEDKSSIFNFKSSRSSSSKRSQSLSPLQGWYNKLYRDEVVAEWKKVKGKMSLHVHCHISGGHFLLDLCAPLRYYIFCKELPVVLNAFVHGDENLFNNNPELQEATVWVYFHSSIPEFNKFECWGPLKCCFPPTSLIPWTPSLSHEQPQLDQELTGDVSIPPTGTR